MATSKRAARRTNRQKPPTPNDDPGSPQSETTVGEVRRGTTYDEVLAMAFPNTVTYRDKMYGPKEAEQITRLRHERWNLLARFNEKHGSQDAEWNRMNHRMRQITKQLYDLTGNAIYNEQG